MVKCSDVTRTANTRLNEWLLASIIQLTDTLFKNLVLVWGWLSGIATHTHTYSYVQQTYRCIGKGSWQWWCATSKPRMEKTFPSMHSSWGKRKIYLVFHLWAHLYFGANFIIESKTTICMYMVKSSFEWETSTCREKIKHNFKIISLFRFFFLQTSCYSGGGGRGRGGEGGEGRGEGAHTIAHCMTITCRQMNNLYFYQTYD